MSREQDLKHLSRRTFAGALTGVAGASSLFAQRVTKRAPQNANATPQSTSHLKAGLPEEIHPFGETLVFTRKEVSPKIQAFQMTQVRLSSGIFENVQEANRGYLHRLNSDRLLHNFRVNAGLSSSAQPLGGWEKPDCELRGHFVGHYLSACALMYSSTGDQELKAKGDQIVAELAKCQAKLSDGYLSAFPAEFFDRLNARKKVWAPFYTIHKIMAGMYDMHQHCDNKQALKVLKGMAKWADDWTAPMPEPHMQDILNTEYGGMNDVLYDLAAATGDNHYAVVGDRFTKKRFFNPLALRRDELRGLHVNTHIPQVIGAARRYEISGDERFHDVADFFWYEITSARAYVTGGTSNGEAWLVEPRRLGAELKMDASTTECCCAYNMLKLTRRLYQWTGDPRYFDYYERTLLNHRLGAINPETGATQYYLSIVPAAWRTFNTEDDSFWCCTGTGIEEFSKLNSSIYFHDGNGLYVNLFISSELQWSEKRVKVSQQTTFPDSPRTTLVISTSEPLEMSMHLRIPYWAGPDAAVKINGRALDVRPSPASYLTIARTWSDGDRVELALPMHLHFEAMPDEATTQAVLYGPLVLAGKLGSEGLTKDMMIGPMGPDVEKHPLQVPQLRASKEHPDSWLKRTDGQGLDFRTNGQATDIAFVPFNGLTRERYSVYWSVV
ncbi:MAG: beta-L-arabinofuranosidase domain-containing protein [Bryobacteraceae bacterium]